MVDIIFFFLIEQDISYSDDFKINGIYIFFKTYTKLPQFKLIELR